MLELNTNLIFHDAKLLKYRGKTFYFIFFFISLQSNYINMQRIKSISEYRKSLHDIVIEESMKAFAKHGIRAVKMDDVAQRLSISKRTIYEMFGNKEQLLVEVLKTYKAAKEEELNEKAANCQNVIELLFYAYYQKINTFKKTNPLFYSDLVKYPSIIELLEKDREKAHQSYHDFLKRGIAEGIFRKDVNIDLITRLLDSVTSAMMDDELYKKYAIEDVFRNIAFVSIRGICTYKGLELFDKTAI